MQDLRGSACPFAAQQNALHFAGLRLSARHLVAPNGPVSAVGYNQPLEYTVLMELSAGVV